MFTRISKFKAHHQTIFALAIAFSVVCFWRGVWGLLDTYLLPSNELLSFGASVIIGIVLLVALHCVSEAMH